MAIFFFCRVYICLFLCCIVAMIKGYIIKLSDILNILSLPSTLSSNLCYKHNNYALDEDYQQGYQQPFPQSCGNDKIKVPVSKGKINIKPFRFYPNPQIWHGQAKGLLSIHIGCVIFHCIIFSARIPVFAAIDQIFLAGGNELSNRRNDCRRSGSKSFFHEPILRGSYNFINRYWPFQTWFASDVLKQSPVYA